MTHFYLSSLYPCSLICYNEVRLVANLHQFIQHSVESDLSHKLKRVYCLSHFNDYICIVSLSALFQRVLDRLVLLVWLLRWKHSTKSCCRGYSFYFYQLYAEHVVCFMTLNFGGSSMKQSQILTRPNCFHGTIGAPYSFKYSRSYSIVPIYYNYPAHAEVASFVSYLSNHHHLCSLQLHSF